MQAPAEAAGVCGGCGCGERALAPAGPLAARLYRLVLADALVESVEARLCWECRGRLAAFARFARRAAHAQRGLLVQAQGGSTFTPWPPRLQEQRAAVLYCGPHDPSTPLPKVEPRPDSVLVVKPEPVDVYEEPPDRVDALALPVPSPAEVRKKKKKKEKGTAKKKNKRAKKKLKEKLIEQNGGESSDGLSDLGSLLDLYTDEKTVSEEREEAKVHDVDEGPVPGAALLELSAAEAAAERERALRSPAFAAHPHKCTHCVDTFESQRAAEDHATAFHSRGGEHACDICGACMESESTLAAHRARHTRRYACDSCAHRTRSAAGARAHARTHRPPRAPPARDDQTVVEPIAESAAAGAGAGAGAGTRPRCVECDKEFSSRKTYRYHLSVIHEGRNRYPCATCGKVYQWKSNLWRHMKNHAARAAGELYCVPCRRAFASVATYTQHLRASRRHVREDQFRYACADCGRRFPTKTRLRDHVDWDHLQNVRHRCDACHKPFKSKMSLYVHVKNVHRRADAGLNLCHVCGKSYQNQAKLKYHIVAMHTTETPYSCARCGAAFGWYSSLYRHQREVHDKIKLQPKRARPKKGEGAAPPPAPAPPLLPHGAADAL